MGRLFWKFFAFVLLAQMGAIAVPALPLWLHNLRQEASPQEERPRRFPDDGGFRRPWERMGPQMGPPGPPQMEMGAPRMGPPRMRQPRPRTWVDALPIPLPLLETTLVGSVLTALLLAAYVAKPIRSLQWAFDAAAAGDLDYRVSTVIGRRADELADLGRDFDRMAGRLKSSMENQRRLLHDVSHELRSPLARVQAAVGLLHEEPGRLAFLTGRIDLEVERIDRLVDELLTLSRLEDGGLGTTPQEIDMHELVSDIVQDVQFEAHDSGVVVTWEERDHVALQGVPQLLHRAIENVVRNAVKHGGHGAVHIETGLDEPGRTYRLRVLDEGPGLAAVELERLFMPFFRGRAAGRPGPTVMVWGWRSPAALSKPMAAPSRPRTAWLVGCAWRSRCHAGAPRPAAGDSLRAYRGWIKKAAFGGECGQVSSAGRVSR